MPCSALGTSLRRQTRGCQRGLRRLGPKRTTAHSARLFAAPDHNNSSWSRCSLESLSGQHIRFFSMGELLRFANFTAENAIGLKSESQNLNRTGNTVLRLKYYPSNFLDAGPRPDPIRHVYSFNFSWRPCPSIFQNYRPGPKILSNSPPGPAPLIRKYSALSGPSQFSDRPGRARPGQDLNPMKNPEKKKQAVSYQSVFVISAIRVRRKTGNR